MNHNNIHSYNFELFCLKLLTYIYICLVSRSAARAICTSRSIDPLESSTSCRRKCQNRSVSLFLYIFIYIFACISIHKYTHSIGAVCVDWRHHANAASGRSHLSPHQPGEYGLQGVNGIVDEWVLTTLVVYS